MLVDVVALLLLLLAIYKGFRRGLIIAVFYFIAFIVGLAAALKLSAAAAVYIGSNINVAERWLPVLAFVAVFTIVVLLVRLGAKLLEGVVKLAMLGWLNRIGGIFFYVLFYFLIFSVLLFYLQQLHIIKEATTKASVVYPVIGPFAPKVMSGIGAVFPVFKNMFQQLLHFFQNLAGHHHSAQYSVLILLPSLRRLQ